MYRLSRGSGIDGLAGMYVLSQWVDYPELQIFRPLLQCRKQALLDLCRNKQLEWLEDPTNMFPNFSRNYIRQLLTADPELVDKLQSMHMSLNRARKTVMSRGNGSNGLLVVMIVILTAVNRLVKELPVINTRYGYLTLDSKRLLEEPSPVVRRVMSALLKFISGNINPVRYKPLNTLISALPLKRTVMLHNCLVFPIGDHWVGVSGALPVHPKHAPIKVGDTIHWEKRWEVKLVSTADEGCSTVESNMEGLSNRQFFVRNLLSKDYGLGRRGMRVVRSRRLPPVRARPALPVIIDEKNTVVAIPHLRYVDRAYGVTVNIKYKPFLSLDSVINQYETVLYQD